MKQPETTQAFSRGPIKPFFQFRNGFSPLDVWLECRSVRQLWQTGSDTGVNDEGRLRSVLSMSENLAAFPAQRWLAFNDALGWTAEAAAVASWCQDASLGDTVKILNELQYLAAAAKNQDLCARLLNPALLPPNRLSDLVNAGGKQLHGIALLIAARAEPPQIDVPRNVLQNFPAHLLSMLEERSGQASFLPHGLAGGYPAPADPAKAPAPASRPALTATAQEAAERAVTLSKNPVATSREQNNAPDAEKQKHRRDLIKRTLSLRGWTEEMLAQAKATPAHPVAVAGHGQCHRYMHPETGAFIIVEAASGDLLHAGQPGFAYRSDAIRQSTLTEPYTDPFYDPQTRRTTIWVPLKYELAEVWCPAPASYMERDIYCILAPAWAYRYEHMLYTVTAYVHCRPVVFDDGIHIAAEKAALL